MTAKTILHDESKPTSFVDLSCGGTNLVHRLAVPRARDKVLFLSKTLL